VIVSYKQHFQSRATVADYKVVGGCN